MDLRSEGEVGVDSEVNESIGEIKFPAYNRSAIGQSKLGNS